MYYSRKLEKFIVRCFLRHSWFDWCLAHSYYDKEARCPPSHSKPLHNNNDIIKGEMHVILLAIQDITMSKLSDYRQNKWINNTKLQNIQYLESYIPLLVWAHSLFTFVKKEENQDHNQSNNTAFYYRPTFYLKYLSAFIVVPEPNKHTYFQYLHCTFIYACWSNISDSNLNPICHSFDKTRSVRIITKSSRVRGMRT